MRTNTAKVKENTSWIYAGHTLKILEKRKASKIEEELGLGPQYKLSLKGTEFEQRYPKSPYTFIHGKDLEVDEMTDEEREQLQDNLLDTVISEIKRDIECGDVSAIWELLSFCPIQNLIQYLPEEKWGEFDQLCTD